MNILFTNTLFTDFFLIILFFRFNVSKIKFKIGVIVHGLLRYLRNVYLDPDPEVQADGLDLLLDTARQTRTESFHAVMDAIESLVMNSENDALCCAGMEGIASLLASTFGTFPKIEKIEKN